MTTNALLLIMLGLLLGLGLFFIVATSPAAMWPG